MKYIYGIIFFVLMLASIGYSQPSITFSGGLNLNTISFTDDELAEETDASIKPGFHLSIESLFGPVIVGAGYTQRGSNWETSIFGFDISGSDTYNYLTGYGLFHLEVQDNLGVIAGLQVGKGLSGKEEGEGDSEVINADDFKFDYGITLGAEFMFRPEVGARITYYHGLAEVMKEQYSGITEYQNRTIGLGIIYKL